jgi:biopolymer transport protein TolR
MAGGMIGPGNGRRKYRPMAEINVTPLVDVMLVLLIVFMVTAPLITSGVSVNLPKAGAPSMPAENKTVTITVNAQDQVFINNNQIPLTNLVATLQQMSQNDPEERIFVRGDKDVSYGDMLQVMATITQGGFTKVALLADSSQTPPPGQ